MPMLELGTLLCPKCYSVPNEPCRENGVGGWAFMPRIHTKRRQAQIRAMPAFIDVIVAGRLIGLRPDETRAQIEEGTFSLPIDRTGRRRTVPRQAVLEAVRSR